MEQVDKEVIEAADEKYDADENQQDLGNYQYVGHPIIWHHGNTPGENRQGKPRPRSDSHPSYRKI
jgi:hypothetical protein